MNNIGPNVKWIKVVDAFASEYDVYVSKRLMNYICLIPLLRVTNKGSLFYIRTNSSAPQYKVITIDIANGNKMKDLIPESEAFLSSIISVNKNYFALTYKRNVGPSIY